MDLSPSLHARTRRIGLLSIALSFLLPLPLLAGNGVVTLIHMGDVHGHLIPRPHFRQGDPDYGKQLGGLAYLYSRIEQIRAQYPDALLINTGDTIQGSAEALYSEGQVVVDILNHFRIDAFVPGNWDFLYGTERFRELFAGDDPKANWHALAANLYYSTLYDFPLSRYPDKAGQRVLPFYLVKKVGDVKVGFIGLTADRGPQVVSPRTTDGFYLTPGEEELRAAVPLLRDTLEVDLVVLLSERGLAANLELVEAIPGVDIVLSSDMHEETWQVLQAKTGTLLVEEGQDGTMLGEMHLTIKDRAITGWQWTPHRIGTENIRPDPKIAAQIHKIRAHFVKGGEFRSHVNPLNASVLRTPIDTVIGFTKVSLHRSNFSDVKEDMPAVIEGSSHDFLADAFRDACPRRCGHDARLSVRYPYRARGHPIGGYLPLYPHGTPDRLWRDFGRCPLSCHRAFRRSRIISVGGLVGRRLADRLRGDYLRPGPLQRIPATHIEHPDQRRGHRPGTHVPRRWLLEPGRPGQDQPHACSSGQDDPGCQRRHPRRYPRGGLVSAKSALQHRGPGTEPCETTATPPETHLEKPRDPPVARCQ
uniref:Calcineurin-like phosphoesterase n=1 Tax=Candidatus Kentrum sp. TUN TaxID=2126343 RepID=A0A451A1S5_9GAMM|nr:MAG: Calcineurin-like phosphoesterase [Candidatus Kentron sp. TUN]VFK59972.1 MAG: Calcineurin-like phosphoesterase [Candidatus Kentron sp. TUN]